MIIYDAKDMIFGRISTKIAKSAIMGEDVIVVNTKDVCLSGSKKDILAKFKARKERGTPLVGPYYPKVTSRLFKRMIRGMFSYRKPRGREAFERIKCYSGVPKALEGKDFIVVEEAKITKLPSAKYLRLSTISQHMGGKQ